MRLPPGRSFSNRSSAPRSLPKSTKDTATIRRIAGLIRGGGPGRSDAPRPHAAGAIIQDDIGRVLLVRTRLRRGWEYPAGGGDHGESAEDTCRREVYEETGLKIATLVPLGESMAPSGRRFHTFFTRVTKAERERLSPDRWEIADARWVSPPEASRMLAPHIRARMGELAPELEKLGLVFEGGSEAGVLLRGE